jgi:putative PIN family toxin of toxin-antitoxin system
LIRVTPDTNVLISAFFYDGNERTILRKVIQGKLRFVLSIEIIDEMVRVLEQKFHVDPQVTQNFALRLGQIADIVPPRRLSDVVVRDRADIKILECASAGKSDYIVTGDRDLLSLKKYSGIRILTGRELLKSLRGKRTVN